MTCAPFNSHTAALPLVSRHAMSLLPSALKSWVAAGKGTVMCPILLAALSTNHNAPSGPLVMPPTPLSAVGSGNSPVITPAVVIRPILLVPRSVNHSAPSGPDVMVRGALLAVGRENSVMTPAVVIRPILLPSSSVNHSAPSGPKVITLGALTGDR